MLRRRPLPRRPPISPRTRGHFRAGSTTPPCSGMPPFTTMGREVLDAIVLNLNLAVVGCTVAIRRFLQDGKGGAIVNVSSHQAQRAVRGALPYATAKAAIEGLTRALAVDYGPQGVRTNAVALGSITTERYEAFLEGQEPAEANRIANEASFINGATVPVDGGRSALGRDPEEA